MNDVVLFQPRIPQNVGAVIRLCAAYNANLHIIRPIPFRLDDKSLSRVGMDYLSLVNIYDHNSWDDFLEKKKNAHPIFFSSKATTLLPAVKIKDTNTLVFGSEEAGLPEAIMNQYAENLVRIPMANPEARCLNLATSVAIGLYEANRESVG